MTFIPNIPNKVSTENTSTTPLGISGVFTGTAVDLINYNSITVTVIADEASVAGGLSLQFDNSTSFTTPVTHDHTIYANVPFSTTIPTLGRYYRVVYTNGGTAQTTFSLTSLLSEATKESQDTVRTLSDGLFLSSKPVQILGHVNGSDDRFADVDIDYNNNLRVNLARPNTAFGEVSVAQNTPQAYLSFPYIINSQRATTTTTNGGTVTVANSFAVVSSSTTTSSTADLRSTDIVRYLPGIGVVMRFAGYFTTGVAGTTQYAGIFDSQDGFGFGFNGTDFGIFRRSGGTTNFTAQSSWNVDKLDGTDKSKNTLDPTKGNVYEIVYQWLGFGAIRFGIENVNTSQFETVHIIKYANQNTAVTVSIPSLPLAISVGNGATTSNVVTRISSMGAFSQGLVGFSGARYSARVLGANVTSNTIQSVLTLENTTNFRNGSQLNKVPIKIQELSVTTESQKALRIEFYAVPIASSSVTTGFAFVDSESTIRSSTSIVSNPAGTLIGTYYLGKTGSLTLQFGDNDNTFVVPGFQIVITCFTTNNTNDTSISLRWTELI